MLVGEDLTPVMLIAPFKRSIFSQSTSLNEYILELETCLGVLSNLGVLTKNNSNEYSILSQLGMKTFSVLDIYTPFFWTSQG